MVTPIRRNVRCSLTNGQAWGCERESDGNIAEESCDSVMQQMSGKSLPETADEPCTVARARVFLCRMASAKEHGLTIWWLDKHGASRPRITSGSGPFAGVRLLVTQTPLVRLLTTTVDGRSGQCRQVEDGAADDAPEGSRQAQRTTRR